MPAVLSEPILYEKRGRTEPAQTAQHASTPDPPRLKRWIELKRLASSDPHQRLPDLLAGQELHQRLRRALQPGDDRLVVAQAPVPQPAPDVALHVRHAVDVAAAAKAPQRQVVGGCLEEVARSGGGSGALVLGDRPT